MKRNFIWLLTSLMISGLLVASAWAGTLRYNFEDADQLNDWEQLIEPEHPGGQWRVENGELVFDSQDNWCFANILFIGNDTWTDYEVEYRFRIDKTFIPPDCANSYGLIGVLVHLQFGDETKGIYTGPHDFDGDKIWEINISAILAGSSLLGVGIGDAFSVFDVTTEPASLEEGVWYSSRVIANGNQYEWFIDGQSMWQFEAESMQLMHGAVGLYTRNCEARFDDVTITGDTIPEELEDYTNVFFTSLSTGLNMVSLPLKPQTPYTARSFAEEIGATVVIKLDEARQRFVGFTLDAPDDGFALEGGKGYIVNMPESKVVAFTGAAWTNQPPVEAVAPTLTEKDGAWAFVVSGRLLDDSNDSLKKDGYLMTVRNTRTNAVATDVVRSRYFAAAFADLNRQNVVQTGDRLEIVVRNQAGEMVSDTLSYMVTADAIRHAYLPLTLKNVEIPRQSLLLPNYPNPFNPETWIPYQIREPAEVVIRIYNANGRLVRTLALGQREAGFYLGRSRAAYWDGHNDIGEKVSSGVYFYQLQADDFNATRKLVIVK
jgi:hypothetical protein